MVWFGNVHPSVLDGQLMREGKTAPPSSTYSTSPFTSLAVVYDSPLRRIFEMPLACTALKLVVAEW